LKIIPFESLATVSYSHSIYYGRILYRFRDERDKILINKSRYLSYPMHSTPPLGAFRSEYCRRVWCCKTRMVQWKKFDTLSRFDRNRRVTDRRTDRHLATARITC